MIDIVILHLLVFDGFRIETVSTVQLRTVVGGSVAMECDFRDGSPRPQIQWFMTEGNPPTSTQITEVRDQNQLLFLESGRYLFIRELTTQQNNALFYCEATNTLLGTSVRSNTTYQLGGVIPEGTLETYLGDRAITVGLGEVVDVVYAAASPGTDTTVADDIIMSCTSPPGGNVVIANDVVARYTGIVGVESDRRVNLTCTVRGTDIQTQVTYSFTVTRKYWYV